MDRHIDGRTGVRMYRLTGHTDRHIDRWMNGQIDGRTFRWKDGRTEGQTDEETEKQRERERNKGLPSGKRE